MQLLAELVNYCDTTVLRFKGEIDLAVRAIFTARLREALAATVTAKLPRLVVDLHEVSFMSSVGLNGLLECTRAGAKEGRDVRVVADATTMRLITVSGLETSLAAYPTLDDAVGGYALGA